MLRTSLCSKDIGATIAVEMMLQYAHNYNDLVDKNKLCIYPIKDIFVPSVVAYHKNKFMTAYAKDFIDIATKVTQKYHENLNKIEFDFH